MPSRTTSRSGWPRPHSRRVVAVAEAKAGLLVAADGLAVRSEDVVALEVEEVPVAVRLRLDEADLAVHRVGRRRSVGAPDELLDAHRGRVLVGTPADEEHRPAPVVLHRGEEREPPGFPGLVDLECARRRLNEIGEELGRAADGASAPGHEQDEESGLGAHRSYYPRRGAQVP
jgi:hypothetical protein